MDLAGLIRDECATPGHIVRLPPEYRIGAPVGVPIARSIGVAGSRGFPACGRRVRWRHAVTTPTPYCGRFGHLPQTSLNSVDGGKDCASIGMCRSECGLPGKALGAFRDVFQPEFACQVTDLGRIDPCVNVRLTQARSIRSCRFTTAAGCDRCLRCY